MKKIILIVAAVAISSAMYAQNLSFGPTASFGHSWMNIDAGDGAKKAFHPSYSVGGKLVYSFNSHWGLSGDVRFSSEGMTIKDESSDAKLVVRANYIRVPIQGIYFFGQYGDRVRPKISLGPSVGFLLGGKTTLYDNDGDKATEVKTKDDVMDGFDFGLTAAAGVNIRLAPAVWLNTDIGYYHGFIDTFQDSDTKSANRNLALNVGVLFGIGTVKAKK